VWRLIKEIFTYEPQDLNTNIDAVLTYLNRVAKRHTILFLISDCMDTGFEKSLRLTAKKHDLTVIRVTDPAEEVLPEVGMIALKDPETGETALINSNSKRLRERWRTYRKEQRDYLTDLFRRAGIDHVELATNGPVVEPLTRLFEMRRRRQ